MRRTVRRIFLNVMVAFALSARELGRREGLEVRVAIVRMIPPEPLYPPRYLPPRRRPLYDDLSESLGT